MVWFTAALSTTELPPEMYRLDVAASFCVPPTRFVPLIWMVFAGKNLCSVVVRSIVMVVLIGFISVLVVPPAVMACVCSPALL